ncbi:hypothetical protein OC25_23790 [Pedobacter kyungheensis]|uniref:Uncharacterized protein n=1 Tax=Pedobacter kyungheensis TaxID=1069985 RepID=A0A0C1DAD6_9SPHI|nr:hypothetical protein [Pedobacter kyungheensis]KIA90925.1 hypothetical protein OC25_23790 [Pedobacter kyungheensis]
MEVFESSEYVIAKAKLIHPYFADKGWFSTHGKNNCILINIAPDENANYTKSELANIISEAEDQSPRTGLIRSSITYIFFHHLLLVAKVTVLPGSEIDL